MLSKIIDVAIVVFCMMAASGCLRKAFKAFHQEGKIALNVYDIINDGKKRNLANLSAEERAKAYKTEGFVFMGFAIALTLLTAGFLMQMFGGNGEPCFLAAIVFEVLELLLIALLIRRK